MRRGFASGRIVDLGCGSGILSEALSKAGYDVLGIDLSKSMLSLAKRRAPGAVFRRGSIDSTPLPPSVAIAAVGECFNYRFDGPRDDRSLARLFRRIRRALEPGGVLLFDMATPARKGGRTHFEGTDWDILVDAAVDRKRGALVRRITTFRRVGARYRRDEEVHRLRLVSSARVVRLLRSAGFTVRRLSGYSRFRFPPGIVGYECAVRNERN